MSLPLLLVSNYRININIFYTSEYVLFYIRTYLGQIFYKLLNLCPLRTFSCTTTGSTSLCKSTGTLYELKIIIFFPVNNISFSYKIHRSYKLHSLKIRTMKLRHHCLNLCTIKHTHKNCFYHIIIMMSKSNLITTKFLCLAVKISSPHSCTQITRRLCNIYYSIKYLCLKYCNWNI